MACAANVCILKATSLQSQSSPPPFVPTMLGSTEHRRANGKGLSSSAVASIFVYERCWAHVRLPHCSGSRGMVEDFELFRRFICSMLRKMPELQIVGEASDGLEAVLKAGELRPGLILLDMVLPTLNGIEAARRIRVLSEKSKLLFVSQQSDRDVVQEALNLPWKPLSYNR
jgi:CheY-like chemotaxis protein